MVDETTSDAHVRGGPPYPSHKVYPAYQVQLLSQPPKSIFRTIHTSYFQTHTLLNRCLCLQLLVGFSLFFCNWHTPYHTMMGTDLLLVIQIYRIPEKLLSNRKQLEWLNRPIFLAFVIAQLIWLNCYCWVKSSMVEGRFQSGSRVLKKVFWTFSYLCISMAYNVISCQKVAENTQILKITKFAM